MNKNKIISLAMAGVMGLTFFTACTSNSKDEGEHAHINFSDYFEDNGNFKGVTATDYVDLLDYSSIVLPYEKTVVNQEEIDKRIADIVAGYTKTEKDETAGLVVKDGSSINIDYVGSVDGVEFDGGSTGGKGTDVIIGVTNYIDGFLDQLVGHKAGDEFDINVTFPSSYPGNPDLENAEAVFSIKINHFNKEVVPEFNDEFIKENSSTMETAQEFIDLLEKDYVYNAKFDFIMSEILEKSQVKEIPQAIKDYQIAVYKDELDHMAAEYNMTAEEYLKAVGYESVDQSIEDLSSKFDEASTMLLIFQARSEERL